MVILLQIVVVFLNLLLIPRTFRRIKNGLRIIHVVLLIFQVVYVFPILLEWAFGIQDYAYKSPGFHDALNDTATGVIYTIFVLFTSLALYFSGNKNGNNRIVALKDIKESLLNFKINSVLYALCVMLMFIPLIMALFSPSPEKYFTEYAYFQQHANLSSAFELWYHGNVMRIGGFLSLIFILITKLFSKDTWFNKVIIFLAAIIAGVLNGKRTLFALIIFAMLAVDILKSPRGKFPIKKSVLSGLFIVFVFVGYAFLIDKHVANVDFIDNLRLYFFRDIDVKFSIYALLNPKEYRIFDYWGQSYLFNLFFYIPRALWLNKPYPYDAYVTAAALGYQPGTILPWSFQTSFFGEALSNFGWFGIPFSLAILNKFIKVSERSENPVIILLCVFVITFSFMNHFGAFRNYFIVWLFLILVNKSKKKEAIFTNRNPHQTF